MPQSSALLLKGIERSSPELLISFHSDMMRLLDREFADDESGTVHAIIIRNRSFNAHCACNIIA